MATKKRILVICVDRDDDLSAKAGISGPVIGREANINAATKLVMADPEEPDANTIFEAVKIYDSISVENTAQVATFTGNARLGYSADKEVSKQLERVLQEFPAESCIFVSDGASDDEVLPLIQSRVRIESKRVVVMKQAKELEKTYFVLLEKLREPYYARLIFGIPALILFSLLVSESLGYGWKPVAVVVSIYLFAKAFGIEESILHFLSGFKISADRISFIIYLAVIPLLIIALSMGFEEYLRVTTRALDPVVDPMEISAYALRRTLLLLPWAMLLLIGGRAVDLFMEKRYFEIVKYGNHAVTIIVLWFIFTVASNWIAADAYFSDFVVAIIASVALTSIAFELAKRVRVQLASSFKLENKEVLTEVGSYIGKIVGVDRKKEQFIVQTALGQKLGYSFERISNVAEKVVIR
ncbi:MAG: DUF373 family protein [Candidatus Micrarchaeota archaeon]